jgi:L-asparaginase/beta-aspartyl-peptidase (threonine type)
MLHTPHVLLAGDGAEEFLRARKLAEVDNRYYSHATATGHDTIGAVARDMQGRLAVATSTGGLSGKRAGRVGDSPIIGAGTWADGNAAVSCTGQGEYFIRAAAASRVSALIEYGKLPLAEAASQVIAQVGTLGGSGGLIAVDVAGNIAMPFNSKGMVRGWAIPGSVHITV